jgi:hypothetical protein
MCNPDLVKFKYTVNEELMEDLLSYNKALEYMTASDLIEEPEWKYNRITGHKEMKPSDGLQGRHHQFGNRVEEQHAIVRGLAKDDQA